MPNDLLDCADLIIDGWRLAREGRKNSPGAIAMWDRLRPMLLRVPDDEIPRLMQLFDALEDIFHTDRRETPHEPETPNLPVPIARGADAVCSPADLA